MPGKRIKPAIKEAARALLANGATVREAARKTGISRASAGLLLHDDDLDMDQVGQLAQRMQGRLLAASDRFLARSLDRLQELGPYQAMLCAGIAHDHYLRSKQADRGSTAGGLTQILIQIDASGRASTTASEPSPTTSAT